MTGYVYLIHFARPISGAHTTQHYTGWAYDWKARLAQHKAGHGARLTQVAVERGIDFDVVQVWPGDRDFERYVKRMKAANRLCPICGMTHRRGPRCLTYQQLALPLFDEDEDDWPELPARMRNPCFAELNAQICRSRVPDRTYPDLSAAEQEAMLQAGIIPF